MIKNNLEMSEYRALPGLSKHELDAFAVAPALYKHKKAKEWKPSRSMEIGTAIHELVLEGKRTFVAGPAVDKRTKAGKEEWQAFCEEHIGKLIVTDEEERCILNASEAASNLMGKFVTDYDVELSMFWQRDGVECKGRPDLIGKINGELSIMDLKTTSGIQQFDSKFFSFRYDVQAAWYQYGLIQASKEKVKPAFWFLVVDTEEPYLAQMICASEELLEDANSKIELDLAYFKRCQDADVWPGLPEQRLMMARSW